MIASLPPRDASGRDDAGARSTATVRFRPLVAADWPAVAEIYRQGVESGDATFETDVPGWADWDAARSPDCRIVAELDGAIVGFGATSPVSSRPVYAGVREVMVYVSARARGDGVGSALLGRLATESEAAGVWTLRAAVFPENLASIRAFRGAGFRVVGASERLGRFRDGRWRDVVLLERRSALAGRD